MNYHLNRNGQNLGVFPLEELRRRRASGELTGNEAVWCPGMTHWRTLDAVLGIAPGVLPQTPTNKPPNVVLIVSVIAGILVLLTICVVLIFRPAFKKLERVVVSSTTNEVLKVDDGIDASTKPVKVNPKAKTSKETQKVAREFRIRQWLEGYQKRGERHDSYDKDAVGFLSNWIACNFGGKVNTNLPSLSELSDKLAANPECRDPLLLTVAAIESVELFEANHRLERALENFEKSKHKAYPKFYAHVTLATKLTKDTTYRVPVLDAAALQFFKECFKDGSFVPEDQEEIAEIFIGGAAENFFSRNGTAVCEAVEAQGEAYKWLSLVLRGDAAIDAAWNARGSGYSDSVTSKGWEGFTRNLNRAEKHFTEAWQLRNDLPQAATGMIRVSLGQGSIDKMRMWFDRAVGAQFDYPGAWSHLRWGLRPRWYGDLDSMLAFGVVAAETKRYDTDVPRMLFDSISDVEAEMNLSNGEHIYGRQDVWPHLSEMYEGYLADPSQADRKDGWRSTYSVVAFLAGHYDVAAKQLEAIHWEPGYINSWGLDLSLMPYEVAARTGNQSAKVKEAEQLRARRKINEALRIYSDLNEMKDLDQRTRVFVRDRVATLTVEKQFDAGQWVSMIPANTNLVGWCLSRGTCLKAGDNAVEIQSGPEGHILFSRARLDNDFEIKGSFEVVKTSNKSFQGGLVMGLPEFETYGWNAFRIKRNADEGEISTFSKHWTSKQIASPVSLSESNSFVLRCKNGRVTASVNEKEIFKQVTPPENRHLPSGDFFLGLGAFNDMNTTTIRYRNVQVKKL